MKVLFTALVVWSSCVALAQTTMHNDCLLLYTDSLTDQDGYKNKAGQLIIPLGKYPRCFTPKFTNYAIVVAPNGKNFIAINRKEEVLYEVYVFDNGPDYPAEGLFRIIINQKIGYANARTGAIVIPPIYDCATPFSKGIAHVAVGCKTIAEGEHSYWTDGLQSYINKKGKRVK